MKRWLRLWFTFEERVGRREYVVSGIVLALVKYAGDAALVWAATGRGWTPVEYLTTMHSVLSRLAGTPRWLVFADVLVSRIHGRVLRHVRALAEAG